jgi:hypothetical protein
MQLKEQLAQQWKCFVDEWNSSGVRFADLDEDMRREFKTEIQRMLKGLPVSVYWPKTLHYDKEGNFLGTSGKQKVFEWRPD